MACREESCCPKDPFTYRADTSSPAVEPAAECPVPVVVFNPAPGSVVILPTFVAMLCSVVGAVIRYTTDGTEPTASSTLYAVPVQITSQYTPLKARAFITGCDPGPITTGDYQAYSTGTWEFGYLCETGDHAGGFNEFAPNGTAGDYQFVLSYFITAAIELVSIEVYQTDSTGFWNSGQSWGTQEYLYPWPDEPSTPFHTYPLVILNKLNTIQWYTEYKDTLGPVGAGTYEYRMWGQPATVLNGYFLCVITLGDGTVIRKLISTTCVGASTVIDPPCTAPSAPGAAPNCTPEVDLDFDVGASAQWKLFRRELPGAWSEIASGTAGVSGIVGYTDAAVEKCHSYNYYVSKLCSGLWYDSGIASALVPCACSIEVTASVEEICPGESVTISWESTHCLALSMSSNGVDFTPVDLNGSTAVSPSVTTSYTLKGTSTSCGEVTEEVEVVVSPCCADSEEWRSLPDTLELIYSDGVTPSEPVTLTIGGEQDGDGLYQMGTVSYAGNDGVVNCAVAPGLCEVNDPPVRGWYCILATQALGTVIFAGYLDSKQPVGSFVKTSGAYASVVTA